MKQLALLIPIFIILLMGCSAPLFAPSPQEFAAATSTILRANSLATLDADNNRALATRAAYINQATATAAAISNQVAEAQAQATATKVSADAGTAQTNADTANVRAWVGGVILFALAGLAVVLIAFALVRWADTRAMMIGRDRTGQLPAVIRDGVIIDISRSLGPAVGTHRDRLTGLWRLWQWARTGKLPESDRAELILSDGGADPDHLLAAAQSSNQTSAVAALMRPGATTADRNARLELIHRGAIRSQWGDIKPPETKVLALGDDAVQILAQKMGFQLPSPTSELPGGETMQVPSPILIDPAEAESEAQ